MSSLLTNALQIARKAHENQFDKGGSPYILHPIFVASLVNTEYEKATALLHDVIEDSELTLQHLKDAGIPTDVIQAVELVTKKPHLDYFEYLESIKENEIARKVKLADLTHNSDKSRLNMISNKDIIRLEKYQKAIEYLS